MIRLLIGAATCFGMCASAVAAGNDSPAPTKFDQGAYLAQFGEGHVTEYPVEAWMDRTQSYTLWKGTLGGDRLEVSWDPATLEAGVVLNGTRLEDVVMGHDFEGRPTFAAAWVDEHPTINGYFDADERTGAIIMEIQPDLGVEVTRVAVHVGENPDDGTPMMAMAATSTCVCFGAPGGTTGSCSTTNCDTGDSCGTANNGTNKACRWKSGTAAISRAAGSLSIDP